MLGPYINCRGTGHQNVSKCRPHHSGDICIARDNNWKPVFIYGQNCNKATRSPEISCKQVQKLTPHSLTPPHASGSAICMPRWNVVHDFMNCSWTFMNSSWKVHKIFALLVHELKFMNSSPSQFMNFSRTCYEKKIVHEQFINSSWKVHIVGKMNKRLWTVHHQFMNCSRTYYEPKNSSWTVHKQFVES